MAPRPRARETFSSAMFSKESKVKSDEAGGDQRRFVPLSTERKIQRSTGLLEGRRSSRLHYPERIRTFPPSCWYIPRGCVSPAVLLSVHTMFGMSLQPAVPHVVHICTGRLSNEKRSTYVRKTTHMPTVFVTPSLSLCSTLALSL